jgi:hypothetical protein
MIVYMYSCSTNPNVKLLVPTKEIPAEALQYCKGEWVNAQQGTWISPRRLDDFEAGDSRIAINSEKAMHDIQTQGFHIAYIDITSTVTYPVT